MESFNWSTFLRQFNAELLASELLVEAVGHWEEPRLAAATSAGWLGAPGATPEQVAQVEARLGTRLPPSYRSFLATSNGWWLATPIIPRLWSCEEIDWLTVTDPDTIVAWTSDDFPVTDEDYFVYGDRQDPIHFRPPYLNRALRISERELAGTAMYLLIPDVVTADGEWEAWMLAHWLPGATRYRSFREMLETHRQDFLADEAHAARRPRGTDPIEVLPTKLPNLIDELAALAQQFRYTYFADMTDPTVLFAEQTMSTIRQLQARHLSPPALLMALQDLLTTLQEEVGRLHEKQEHHHAQGLNRVVGQLKWFINEMTAT